MITAREYSFEKKQKQYTTEFSTINLEESKKEINKIFKKFKKNNNFDKITIKIDIKYHENDEYLFYRGL